MASKNADRFAILNRYLKCTALAYVAMLVPSLAQLGLWWFGIAVPDPRAAAVLGLAMSGAAVTVAAIFEYLCFSSTER